MDEPSATLLTGGRARAASDGSKQAVAAANIVDTFVSGRPTRLLRLKEVLATEYYQEQCRSMFHNPTMFPSIYTFNAINRGVVPHSTNTVATQGSDDPRQTVGARGGPWRSRGTELVDDWSRALWTRCWLRA